MRALWGPVENMSMLCGGLVGTSGKHEHLCGGLVGTSGKHEHVVWGNRGDQWN